MRDDTPLPKLPGYSVALPLSLGNPAFHKKQTLVWKNGYAVPVEQAPPASSPAAQQASQDWQPVPHHTTTYGAVTANITVTSATKHPKWLEYDKKVLRYYGFFQEEVPDSREEGWRVRKVVILLYLEDDSLQVTEPPEPNSGLAQGTFIMRHKIPKSNGGFLGMADLLVGSAVSIYGRTIHICDADAFTRSFTSARSIYLADAQPYPANPIALYHAEKAVPSGLSRSDEDSPSKYAEALLGKEAMNRQLKQFLECSKQVLRFYCIYDDRNSLYGDRRPYKLHYFLEDNTVEILEILESNSGKDPFPSFLKRGPLPKVSSVGAPGSRPAADLMYKPQDLRIGGTISVHGRDFFIFDCDEFTRKYYKENLGVGDGELLPIDVSEPKKPLPTPGTPAYNGFGSLEDSLQNCLKLVPTAPKRDLVALMNKDRIVLRFKCKLLDGSGHRLINTDKERRFVLSFFCADDTLSMFEPLVPNSGITGGKFLERAKAYKPGPPGAGAHYTEHDLAVGACITLAGRNFELLEADRFTEEYLSRLQPSRG